MRYHYWRSLSFSHNHFSYYNSFKCLLCCKIHCIQNCKYLSVIYKNIKSRKSTDSIIIKLIIKLNKLIAVNLHCDKLEFKFKCKKRKQKIFNTEIKKNSSSFSSKFDIKENIYDKIVTLFKKKTASKMFNFNWVADFKAFTYITNQLQLFSDFLICTQHQQIKVGKKNLYFYYCEVTVMQNKSKNFVNLNSTLYVFKLKVNLLLRKQMCKMKLYESFDQHNLYMWNKHDRIIIEAFKQNRIYIVKHIAKSLNEFALLSVMYTLFNLKIVLSATKLNINSQIQICEFLVQTEVSSIINIIFSNKRIKIYKLWHQQFVHLDSAKLHDLYKITILKKSILIIKNKKNVYKICVIIKFINQ